MFSYLVVVTDCGGDSDVHKEFRRLGLRPLYSALVSQGQGNILLRFMSIAHSCYFSTEDELLMKSKETYKGAADGNALVFAQLNSTAG